MPHRYYFSKKLYSFYPAKDFRCLVFYVYLLPLKQLLISELDKRFCIAIERVLCTHTHIAIVLV